ncbi:hypothetical protein ACBJ59_23785 [Nonomuraea sp. MTCD27]|uniref:hypothetical protein n=1 Tax=Nonomuraea sp. MTCD27 TaxID=1676747 RepID=UPI0035C08492
MAEGRRSAMWSAILISSGALAGLGVFLYDHTLQSADQLASVGGFVTGVVGMVGAALGTMTSRRSASEATVASPLQEPAVPERSGPTNIAIGCGVVINGDGNTIDASQELRKGKKRKPRRRAQLS